MGVAMAVMLGLVVLMFEKAGERMGFFFDRRTKIRVILVGLTIAVALNAELFIDHGLARPLKSFDFAFFVGFTAFSYGMFDRKDIKVLRPLPRKRSSRSL
jgi:hypothetical protein